MLSARPASSCETAAFCELWQLTSAVTVPTHVALLTGSEKTFIDLMQAMASALHCAMSVALPVAPTFELLPASVLSTVARFEPVPSLTVEA